MRIPGRTFDEALSWAVDGFVCLFGAWSLISQAAVLAGATGRALAVLSPLAVPAGAAAFWLLARPFRREAGTGPAAADSVPAGELRRPDFPALGAALVLAAAYAFTGLYVVFWIAASAFLLVAYRRVLRAPALRPARPDVGPAGLAAFALAAVLAAGSTLFVLRPQSDDSFYLSVAAAVHDHPDARLMSWDTLSGRMDKPFQAPQHRLRTYDLLIGLTARWLGMEPIEASHLLFPPLFALLFVAAAARFLRLLLGPPWAYGLAAVIVLLLANGDMETAYGNAAFVLLFQGKAVVTTLMVPILAFYGWETVSGRRKTLASAALLGLALAAAISLSTNALFVGSIAAGLGMAGAWRPDRERTRRLAAGAAVLLFPLALGLFLKEAAVSEPYYKTSAVSWLVMARRGLGQVLGWRPFEIAWLTALLGGWAILPDRPRRRFAAGLALAFVGLFMNPLLSGFWAKHLTSAVTFFRLYWAIPLPFLLAGLFAGLPLAVPGRLGARLRPAVFAALLAAFILAVPFRWTVSPSNYARLGRPAPKVRTTFYAAARRLVEAVPPGLSVLAPDPVGEWIPTIAGHPEVVSRRIFLDEKRGWRTNEMVLARRVAYQYVSGALRPPTREEAEAKLGRVLDAYRVGGVVVMRSNRWLGDINAFLRARGFRRVASPSAHFLLYSQTHT